MHTLNDLGGWQVDVPQRVAVTECNTFNSFQLATFHIRQGFTFTECIYPNNFDAWHDHSTQERTLDECRTNIIDCVELLSRQELGVSWRALVLGKFLRRNY
eukprot:scaffold9515_cov136-Skeletonema_dohrnii-CCMP3373.AAC.4